MHYLKLSYELIVRRGSLLVVGLEMCMDTALPVPMLAYPSSEGVCGMTNVSGITASFVT